MNYFGIPLSQLARKPVRVPLFHAVPGRARRDGWTPLKQAEFIGELAETRSVTEAARRLGLTRETAYRLRRRKWSASFVAAWDAALGRKETRRAETFGANGLVHPSRKVTNAELEWRVETGIWRVIMRDGRYCGVHRKADNSALLALLRRGDAARQRTGRR